jgi:hypothetical protein
VNNMSPCKRQSLSIRWTLTLTSDREPPHDGFRFGSGAVGPADP